jgi:hypothetical protein
LLRLVPAQQPLPTGSNLLTIIVKPGGHAAGAHQICPVGAL